MKKQILILVVFLLAAFAGVNKAYAQPGPLTPAPGIPYPYGVTVTGVTSGVTYLWTVTQDAANVLTGTPVTEAAGYFTAGAAAEYTAATINLTWKPLSTGKTFYLVVKTSAQGSSNGVACTVTNMKVYEIKPINSLLLTVNAANPTNYTDVLTATQICAPDISAIVATPNTSVSYVYNTTTLYYNIKAEGMVGKWSPVVRIPALGGNGQSYTDVSWSVNQATPSWTTMTGFTAGGATQDLTVADVDASVSGLNYLVRLTINNAGFETVLADQSLELKVDGFIPLSGTPLVSDIIGSGATPYAEAGAFAKSATWTVTKRPTVTENSAATFMTKAP